MSFQKHKRKCFTFTWNLENASYCLQKKGKPIKSPAFEVHEIEETKWALEIYPRGKRNGNYIGFHLFRERDSKGAAYVEIEYELTFIARDGSVLKTSGIVKSTFPKDDGYGYSKFVKREDVFLNKRSLFLPQDTLTARCRMWKSVGEMLQDVRLFARTRVRVQKRSFQWSLENFSTLEAEKKYTYVIKSLKEGAPLMSLALFVTGGINCDEIIRFELNFQDTSVKYSTLRLYLVDAAGTRVQCNKDEFWHDDQAVSKSFSFFFTKQQIMAKESLYLPDDVLTLYWEWVFSKGIAFKEIEEIQHGFTSSESKISDPQNLYNEKMQSFPHTLNDNLKSLYDENFLCDVELKTTTRVFPVHKVILSASSSVFKAMFSCDMIEKDRNFVNIEDLSDDVISRMLVYIYTSRVEDLTFESASHLYVAADKYAILNLKNLCSSYLKDNLSSSNACEVLLLSDLHADSDLKSAVQDYILKHVKDIVNSDEWKYLMETNAKLAAEAVCLQYK